MAGNRDEPLKGEAAKRAEWRGEDGERARPEGGGGTLPASEDDDERMEGGDGGRGGFGIVPPPD
ncbi:MAG TPA: hypothetical protein VNT77_04790 [Allosphingosinicella sp.]|nr:hypothetical protein [Allosphingosinicella sp.]